MFGRDLVVVFLFCLLMCVVAGRECMWLETLCVCVFVVCMFVVCVCVCVCVCVRVCVVVP